MRAPSPDKRVTLQDIAKRTGVTVNTVSRALKNKPDISPATCKRIQQVAQEMGYVRNYAASSLRSGQTKTLGLILGAMSNPYYAVVADAVHEAASAFGYTLLTLTTREDPEQEMRAVETALSRQVDGILLFPGRDANAAIQRMRETRMPYVLMSRSLGSDMDDCVTCDEDDGGVAAAFRHRDQQAELHHGDGGGHMEVCERRRYPLEDCARLRRFRAGGFGGGRPFDRVGARRGAVRRAAGYFADNGALRV